MKVVVIGAGMAAVRFVECLVGSSAPRSARTHPGADDPIEVTLIGDETHLPYNRILLSAVLEGTHSPESLTLRTERWYADHGVDLRLGTRVLAIDTTRRDVMLVDGETITYDRLVLATGSIPTLPPIRGLVQLDGRLHDRVHAFRHLDDCTRLLQALTDTQRAVVVGGGLLGLQVARALSVRGVATEIVEGGDHLLRSQVGTQAGRILARDLRRLGTEVYTGARAVRLTDGPGGGLRLDNGHTLTTDVVVMTAGGRPSTALARNAGLDCRRGIVVDDTLTTSDPHVHAIGDCAQHGDRTTGFVPPAWEQAEVLAVRLAGGETTYEGSRTVARLRATDLEVAVLGDPENAVGEVVEVSDPVVGSHRRLVVAEGRIVAAVLVGDLSRIGLITQLYDRQTRLAPHEPGDLLLGASTGSTNGVQLVLGNEAEVCACAGVTAGAIRACASLEAVRDTTRATTGCGGCTSTVQHLLDTRPSTSDMEGAVR